MTIGYFSLDEKTKSIAHCSQRNVKNVFEYPAITQKLCFVDSSKAIVNPYQKSQ
eukprot:c19511_g1_i1 orf=77-238(-)